MPQPKIWFTADLHVRHKNILRHCPDRVAEMGLPEGESALELHDEWILDQWNSQVGKKDVVYVLGDFSFAPALFVQKYLDKMRGTKFLILGNHDESSDRLTTHFKQITQLKMSVFKPSQYPFLKEELLVFMCHYPMVTWPQKHYGAVQLHGHCHGRLDAYNDESTDLRFDVGLDGRLAKFRLVSLEQAYEAAVAKAGGMKLRDYALLKKEEVNMII